MQVFVVLDTVSQHRLTYLARIDFGPALERSTSVLRHCVETSGSARIVGNQEVTVEPTLPRGPAERASAEKMQMQMKHRLPSAASVVHNGSVALQQAQFAR